MTTSKKPGTYSASWKLDEPFTIVSYDHGECCCPGIVRLPCGDLWLGIARGGDFHFAGASAWWRSSDDGVTWKEDLTAPPHCGQVFVNGETVRCYDRYCFGVKDSNPRRFIFRYVDSLDGGRTFTKHGLASYDTMGRPEGDSPTLAGPLSGGMYGQSKHIEDWRDVLDAAGWKGDTWVDAPVTWTAPGRYRWLTLSDGSLLAFCEGMSATHGGLGNTIVMRSTDGGLNWSFLSLANPERYERRCEGYSEATPMLHADGRITVIVRYGGGGYSLVQVHSYDQGRTWTEPEELHPRSPCVLPKQHRLQDGALVLTHGRPGMWVCFDPVGDGRHWEFDARYDLWDGEKLSLETMAQPETDRKDLRKYTVALAAPIETLGWARPELMNGYFCGWENLDFEELPNGDLLVVYDVQNWIKEPGAKPVKAIRCVRLRKG